MKYVMFVAILLISLFTRIGLCEESLIAAEERGKLDRIINNHTYKLLIAKRTITLKNGSFKDREKPENYLNASLVKYTVVDLNEDGKLDGMVIIEHHSLGSGSFYEISGLINKNGQYVQTQPILLGDNIQIKDIRSTNSYPWAPKEIEVTILAHNESDSHAKPTLEETHYYSLDGNELKECKHIDIVKKPAIYLYPPKKTSIDITLHPKGKIIQSIPLYENKWHITADKSGLIDKKYRYLFYEVALDKSFPLSEEGWSVQYNALSRWFDKHLNKLGLNKKEATDFKTYWLKNLPPSNYYTIKMVQPEIVNGQLGLKIDPEPDSLLRVLLYFVPSESTVSLKEPKNNSFTRKGFVVVEWGGILK